MKELESKYQNLIELLERRARSSPQKIAYTFLNFGKDGYKEVNLTYQDVYDNARAVAVSLKKCGLNKGDRVIIFSSQTYDNVYSVFGSIFAGAIFMLIPPPMDESKKIRFNSVLESSRAKFILCNNMMEHMLGQAAMGGKIMAGDAGTTAGFFNVEKCKKEADEWEKPDITEDTPVCLQYSSGSTNSPKGVVITHGNFIGNMESLTTFLGEDIPQTLVSWAPIFHNMGLSALVFANAYFNARSVIMSPAAFMENPLNWLKAVSDYKGELILAPNSSYEFCTRVIDDRDLENIDLSTVKYAVNGSEPIHFNTLQSFADKFEKCGFKLSAFCPGYGLAEATCFAAAVKSGLKHRWIDYESMRKRLFVESADENAPRKQMVSVGKPLNGTKIIAVNYDTGELCKENEIGELWIQGPSVAVGYWKLDEETGEAFQGVIENHEGYFLKTGDLGAVYQGEVYIAGRLKELIIINGHNIVPQDIAITIKENVALLRTSTIVSFAVNADSKERFVTCVEVPGSIHPDYAALADSISKSLYSVYEFSPYDIVFVKEGSLPRTDNKKIRILKAKEFYEAKKLETIYCTRDASQCGENERKIIGPGDETEEKLLSIFKKVIGSEEDISTDDNFFAIGGDSLAIVQLAALVEKEFNIVIPVKYLMETPTVQGAAKYLKAARSEDGAIHIEADRKFLYRECSLDETIRPGKYEDTKELKPENIFITGATGFVGAYLIKDLMELTEARVYCHVRAKDESDGFRRIKSNMEYYKIWSEEFRWRIIPVIGDLSKPLLGMDEQLFDTLSKTIDTIYHSGALLNFIYPYSHLKNTNVNGTIECLRLACKNKPKYFHHVSTFSVFDNPSHFEKIAYEDDELRSPEGYYLGYTESKWVAEKLVRIAEERGLRVTIYRPGEISGASTTGIWKMNDMVSRFFVSAIQMGAMPDVPIKVHITPVDFVSRAIAYISLQKESIGHAFNLVNKNIKTVSELAKTFNSLDYDLDLVSFDEWKEKLGQAGQNNALKLLESLFYEQKPENESITRRYADLEAIHDTACTKSRLEGSDIACVPVNKELIWKYLSHFKEMEYIS